jgi:Ni,Fe-hydrogenase III large subunit
VTRCFNSIKIVGGMNMRNLIEQHRQQTIEDIENLKKSVNKALDAFEELELGLKYDARVYTINQLISISVKLDCIKNALNDIENS